MSALATLERATFRTSRLLDFASEKELIAQIGHQKAAWPLVILKELVDNAIDTCEEAGIAPRITVATDRDGITIEDNGPGIPADVVEAVLDFSVRVSSREAYVSPTRGAQGNALKTILAMPFVLDGVRGRVQIEAGAARHVIDFGVDRIRQRPTVEHRVEPDDIATGTRIKVHWPDSACSILKDAGPQFYKSPASTPGSVRTCRSPSTGSASVRPKRRPTRCGRSGSPPTRPRRIGTRPRT
jgi:DNA topoisomerase VI subunit B